ncbi:MAG: phosphotransferase [Chloroflexi bacterium]|nr:phosphotransferase [Chloroflexota bacterium]
MSVAVRALAAQIEQRLSTDLGIRISKQARIEPGQPHNNRLLHVWSDDGRDVVVKVYFQDDRHRLDREFSAIAYLRGRGFAEVPTAFLRDDEYGFAVYSYEPGETRVGAKLGVHDVEGVAEFAARLHHIHPGEPGAHFRKSVPATFSFADQVAGIRHRLAQFTELRMTPAVPAQVRELRREVDVIGGIEQLIGTVLAGADDCPVPPETWSLASGDLAPHNVLFGEQGSIRVLDLEYSG